MDEGNSNIVVEITDPSEFHCFRLLLNPKSAPGEVSACCGVPVLAVPDGFICAGCAKECEVMIPGSARIEVMLHARSLVDLIHKCSIALSDWQKDRTDYLIERLTAQLVPASESRCRVCGCTMENPCRMQALDDDDRPILGESIGCSWIEVDLCTGCDPRFSGYRLSGPCLWEKGSMRHDR